jgi:MFS family permease
MGLSTTLVWFSWLLIGLAYPLYNVFLPTYLASRGAKVGGGSPYIIWRNYAINNTCSIFGPVLAGFMCRSPWFWGRRGTMIIGALVTMIFFFCYTQVRTASQNVGFTCAISFCLNIYYGTLYAYTPEVCSPFYTDSMIAILDPSFDTDSLTGIPIWSSWYRERCRYWT